MSSALNESGVALNEEPATPNSRKKLFIRLGVVATITLLIISIIVGVLATRYEPNIYDEILPSDLHPEFCPISYKEHPMILISMDGMRPDYLSRGYTPTLDELLKKGASAPYMKPSYPSLTFPNHYTIVTGLYPESHGIIANSFYDREYGKFSMGSTTPTEGKWWGGEPLWNTLTRHNKKSATMFWPGSEADIGGTRPTYWREYIDDYPFNKRVDQVMQWLLLAEEKRPSWISLYFNEPDHTLHEDGPNSEQINQKLVYVDKAIKYLFEEIYDSGLTSCVNVILVSDHGGAASSEKTIIHLNEYLTDVYNKTYYYGGAFSRLEPKNENDSEFVDDIIANLTCKREELRAFKKQDLPTRFHFNNNGRIEDVVLDLDSGFTTTISSNWTLKGNHGYDNYIENMNAVFFAYGPDINLKTKIKPFQNIQLYNFMCGMLGIEPAPNNGTVGTLNDVTSLQIPTYPGPKGYNGAKIPFPADEILPSRYNVSKCAGNITQFFDWVSFFNFTSEGQKELEKEHAPFGMPLSFNASDDVLNILHQHEFIMGFAPTLKLPLWISSVILGDYPNNTPDEYIWYSDVRLDSSSSPSCDELYNVTDATISPLFPPRFFLGLDEETPNFRSHVVSNAILMTQEGSKWWKILMDKFVSNYYGKNTHGFQLIVGPVYDWNADSYPDNAELILEKNYVPSDLFAILMSCSNQNLDFNECKPDDLDVRAFILPQNIKKETICMDDEAFLLKYSCRIQDVEIATGLTFLPYLKPDEVALNLKTRIDYDLWPLF